MGHEIMMRLYSYNYYLIENFYRCLLIDDNYIKSKKLVINEGDRFRIDIDYRLLSVLGCNTGTDELFLFNEGKAWITLYISNSKLYNLYDTLSFENFEPVYVNKYLISVSVNSEVNKMTLFKLIKLFMAFIFNDNILKIGFDMYFLNKIDNDNKLVILNYPLLGGSTRCIKNNGVCSDNLSVPELPHTLHGLLSNQVVTSFLYDKNISVDDIFSNYYKIDILKFSNYIRSIKYTYPLCIFNNIDDFYNFAMELFKGDIRQEISQIGLNSPLSINRIFKGLIHVYDNFFVVNP